MISWFDGTATRLASRLSVLGELWSMMAIAANTSELGYTAAAEREVATPVRRLPGLAVAGIASIGAGAIHAAAAGIHAEHTGLARIFVVMAALQLGAGLLALVRPSRFAAAATAVVSVAAVAGWLATRITGISWVSGLESREAPQFADSLCALLGGVAAGAAVAALLVGWRMAKPISLLVPTLVVSLVTVPSMVSAGTHVHTHSHTEVAAGATGGAAATDGHTHDHSAAAPAVAGDTTATTVHQHGTVAITDTAGAQVWPRPWDPTQKIDFSGVPGVSAEQQARAELLAKQTLIDLPKYATTAAAIADGYRSIGDAGTGSEHYVKYSLIQDDDLLDPKAPESLVYTVKGDQRILAGAMFISKARSTDDPVLTNWAGPLMQWHNHGNLCWGTVNGAPAVVGIVDASGKCAKGVNTGGANPMVHVWITPHPCGVFAALEGVGAGQAAVPDSQRTDLCGTGHTHTHTASVAKPYDPTQPIDLSGTPGVTPEQQAAAENLVAVTLVTLPKMWSDYKAAEAAGFTSIGDGATGFEHYIHWDWINDSDTLDPARPESLVYQPQPDGSKKLVSAMYMLPDTVALDKVPDIGGALMQWHIHDNLCFTTGAAPKLAGITSSKGGCPSGLVKFQPAPMIHVWVTTNKCGPFAALEGVGAGQVAEGQTTNCDHVHGSTTGL